MDLFFFYDDERLQHERFAFEVEKLNWKTSLWIAKVSERANNKSCTVGFDILAWIVLIYKNEEEKEREKKKIYTHTKTYTMSKFMVIHVHLFDFRLFSEKKKNLFILL